MKFSRFIRENMHIENIILLIGLLISLFIFINSFIRYFKEKKYDVGFWSAKKEILAATNDNTAIVKKGQVLYNTPL